MRAQPRVLVTWHGCARGAARNLTISASRGVTFDGCSTSLRAVVRYCTQLARFSLVRAAERIAAAKRQRADPDNDQGAEERASEEGVRAVRASCRMSAQRCSSNPVWRSGRQGCSCLLVQTAPPAASLLHNCSRCLVD